MKKYSGAIAWIHNQGDDEQIEVKFNRPLTKSQAVSSIKNVLKKEESAILEDFSLIECKEEQESDVDLIGEIVKRGYDLYTEYGLKFDNLGMLMDLTAIGSQLRLRELLGAKECDFLHDLIGIEKHLNRTTKKLENCFVPRYSI